MRTGHQGFRICGCRFVNAHHVAHGVNAHLVKAAGLHAQLDRAGAFQVCVGQVSDGQFFACGVRCVFVDHACIAELGQPFVPVPHFVAQRGLVAQLVVEANLDDAVDVAQALGQFVVGVVVQAALKGADDLLLVEARAARAAHGQDERKTKLGVVAGVELLDVRKLFRCAVGQARFGLLVGRFSGEAFAHHRFACQLGVGTHQGELRCAACFF